MKIVTTDYEGSAFNKFKVHKENLEKENLNVNEPVSCCIVVPFTYIDDKESYGKARLKYFLSNDNKYSFDELIVSEVDFKELVKKSKIKTALLKL